MRISCRKTGSVFGIRVIHARTFDGKLCPYQVAKSTSNAAMPGRTQVECDESTLRHDSVAPEVRSLRSVSVNPTRLTHSVARRESVEASKTYELRGFRLSRSQDRHQETVYVLYC